MADDLSLLFSIRRGVNDAPKVAAETRAAVAQLRSSLGTEFNQIQQAGQKALGGIGDSVNTFVGARVPLIGGAFLRVTENLKGVGTEAKKVEADIAKFGKTIDGLSQSTGKSKSELIGFLTSFVQLGSQSERDVSAVKFLGSAFDEKLIPSLEKAGTELSTVATSAGAAGSSIGAVAGPVGIATVALIALHVAMVAVVQKFLELTVATAEWQGKLHDQSQQTEISVETLSGLEVALRKTGGSLDSATNALITFQTKLSDAQDPMSDTAVRFEALGITATDTEAAFRQALLAVAAMPDGFEKVNTAAELFGRRGAKQLLAAIKETDGDLGKLIKQLRAAGVLLEGDAARAADEFNDQLLMVQLQVRALTAELVVDAIPQILAALRATSKIIQENKEAISIVGDAIGLFVRGNVYGILLPALKLTELALKSVEKAWLGVKFAALVAATGDAEAAAAVIKAAEEARNRVSPFEVGDEGSGLGGDLTTRLAVKESQERLKQAKFEAAEQSRLTADRLAQIEQAYQQGKITREKEQSEKIAAINAERDAQLNALQAEEAAKQQEQLARQGDVVAQRKIAEEIDKIRQASRNLQSETNRKIAEEEQKAQQDRAKATIEHLNNLISLRRKHADNEIAIIEARIKANEVVEEEGAKQIADIQNRVFAERRKTLSDQLASAVVGGLSQQDRDQIIQQRKELNLEIAAEEKRQAERLKQIAREQAEFERELLLQKVDTQLRLGTIRDSAQIASLRALGALRIRTEEETERAILAIRLAAIDRQADAIRARITAAASIADPKARQQAEAQLNADLEILAAERKALEEQGERDTEAGRQRDVESKRRQIAALRDLDDQIADGDLDRRRRELELLAEREGLNRRTIALFRQLTLDEEAERHKRIVSEIEAQRAEANAIDVGGKNKLEIEQKYNELREQENQRFHDRQDEINAPGGADTGKARSKGTIEGVFDDLDKLRQENPEDSGLVAVQAGVEALTGAFSALGQAVGQVVEAWVLYGSAGTSVRKVTAQILAGVAAQAAIKAVFELAEGFAALALAFFGLPNAGPSASAHFAAAAIYGSIAGIAAIAGRSIAGDAFKQTAGGTGASGSSSRGGSSDSGKPTAIDVNRNVQPTVIVQLYGDIATDALKVRVVNAVVESLDLNDDRLTTQIQSTAQRGR